MEARRVADIEGPWCEPGFESSLINRLRENWDVPIGQVSNYVLATFIRQRRALTLVLPEAHRRLLAGFTDGTELYEEELSIAISEAPNA
jgi:hypothetical protein